VRLLSGGLTFLFALEIEMPQERFGSIHKPAANVARQIQTLTSHKVRFDGCSPSEAEIFLTESTYFFKLKAFDNKFDKDSSGNYFNLDFSFLQDVSTIDYHIRQCVIQLTSDIEHCLKVRFNTLLMRQSTEDGYSIVQDFIQHETDFYRHQLNKEFSLDLKSSAYTGAIIDKYGTNPPAWLLWEVCSFNTTNAFYKFFIKKNSYADPIFSLLDGVRLLRNAASHNNCLLTAPSYRLNKTDSLTTLLEQLIPCEAEEAEHDNVIGLAAHDPLIHDFSCVLCCHINLVKSQGIITRTEELLNSLIKRIGRHYQWYKDPQNHCKELERQLNAIASLSYAFKHFSREKSITRNLSLTKEPLVYKTRHRHRSRSK
jgi:abortive infection bacteriophage resistance protein